MICRFENLISVSLNKFKEISTHNLYWILIFIAIIIAAQMQYIQHGWINPDSILYFESARLIAIGDWQQAIKTFNWPLYSTLIASLHKISGLSLHRAAQILNVVFFAITTASFLKIIQISGGNKKVMLAGSLILFSSSYLVGDVLEMLMRDQGFWAFFLTSLYFFIRFYQSDRYLDAILWQLSIIIATLFRIEGITYLILLPLMIFLDSGPGMSLALRRYIRCNLINISLFAIVLIAVYAMGAISPAQIGRLNEIFTVNLYTELTQKLFSKSVVMSAKVLGPYLDEFAVQSLLLTFIYVIIVKIISTTGIANTALAYMAVRAKSLPASVPDQVLKWTAIIAVINMALIITKVFVLSGRYVLALSLILMLYAAFYLAELFKYLNSSAKNDKKWKWLLIILLSFLILSAVKNLLPKRGGYNYQQDAVSFLKSVNTLNKPVFYDDIRARYYANEPYHALQGQQNWDTVVANIEAQQLVKYDYLMISFSSKNPEREKVLLKNLPNFYELKRFKNADAKKYVVIYKKRSA